MARDRRLSLLSSTTTNGIDFVEVASADQTVLRVHFLNSVPLQGDLATDRPPVTITGGETITTVTVNPIDEPADWSADGEGRPVLTITVAQPGDFSFYTLSLNTVAPASGSPPVLDPVFSCATFTFKVNCPTTLDPAALPSAPDGAQAPSASPPPATDPGQTSPAIDYTAKDYASFRQALSDFSALRYPSWIERSEADIGVVLMEALCAVADDLSYYQDRVAAEATLDTATQAVSILRHARLVDYEPAPATVASALIQLDVTEPFQVAAAQPDSPGLLCSAQDPSGQAVPFEAGGGLADPPGPPVRVDPLWNRYLYDNGTRQVDQAGQPVDNLVPYWWDDSAQILLPGTTEISVTGTGFGFTVGQLLVLDTDGPTSADPHVRELLTISQSPAETTDYVFDTPVTRLTFTPALASDHDLAASRLAGNLASVVQGARATGFFAIPPVLAGTTAAPAPPAAIVRAGHDGLTDYRYTLGSASAAGMTAAAVPAAMLSWLPGAGEASTVDDAVIPAHPDLVLTSANPDGTQTVWTWRRSLLDVVGPEQGTAAFTLTPEHYTQIAVVNGLACYDYDGDDGTTIRFGDGTFGQAPVPGMLFTVSYRTGLGAAGNVPADTITSVVPGQAQASLVLACTNPFAASGGASAETPQQIRDRAPQQFRSQPLCVVRAEDYVGAAQSLPWVAQAGTAFRWTGSWLAAYTTADPAAAEQLSADQLTNLTELLNRQRLAGYPSYVLSPRYFSVDLRVTVLAEPDQFQGNVQEAVLTQLRPGTLPGGGTGFFDHSRWRFGMPLDPSALAAAVQGVPGVAGVQSLEYRPRGILPDFSTLTDPVIIPPDQILRMDDDPSRPEAGSLAVLIQGGK